MKTTFARRARALASCALLALSGAAHAYDTDIFVGGSGGTATAANVIFVVDNSPNWSRSSQHWPDNNGVQGVAELNAISQLLSTVQVTNPINVGLAMLSEYAGSSSASAGATPGTGGGYIRFGVRDVSQSANKTALQNILAAIANNITDPTEKLSGMASKDEAAGFYEIYKYLSNMTPFSGVPSQNLYADIAGNTSPRTAAGQGLTSGFAIANGTYQSPITSNTPCAKTYIIYMANNANNTGSIGQSTYEPTIASVAPALAGTSGLDTWLDEWTRYMYSHGVVVPTGNNNGSVVTYVLDAYNAQQNTGYSNSLINAAKVGGGRYFAVNSQSAILSAISSIFAEIQSANSTFAAASLPVNTTNRAQDKNQVFIPMFRPDPNAYPRWMGNLKQYQLINTNGSVQLGDVNANPAVNPLTGFPTDCATSFWTTDSGTYWSTVTETPIPKGQCPSSVTTYDPFSDAPDGPIVEKGGVAEVIRKGNNPATTNSTPTWAVNRTIYTLSGNALTTFNTTSSGLSSTLVNFISGHDVNDENGNGNTTETRPSLHGDTIHSRPLPIDYGGTTGVTVFYGSNDGMLRAIDSTTGQERWSFVAPEFFPTLNRLMTQSPLVNYPTLSSSITPTPIPKDFYFDGSLGVYQNADNSKVWIYPTMRRGGRMLYALDVTTPGSPVFKWKAGCPNLTNDTGCSTGMSGIGQTWSKPAIATTVNGYTGPVMIVGGGYDTCEDANNISPSCSSPKGAAIYVFDADTGVLLKTFPTTRSVAADVALAAITTTGVVDHAYAADTGGNVYRIDFGSSVTNWTMTRVAYTNGAGRKFLYPPALLPAPNNKVYLALGSGDREHPLLSDYPYGNVVNRFYVYVDDLSSSTATNLDDTDVMNDYTNGSSCSTAGILPGSTPKGWFMNLNQNGPGEQTVTSAVIASGLVAFSTNRPIPPTQGSCSTSLGEARGYLVSLFNGSGAIGVGGMCGGSRSSIFAGGGLPPSPVLGVVPINGKPVAVIIGAVQRAGGASTAISPQQVTPSISSKRKTVYWRSSGQN